MDAQAATARVLMRTAQTYSVLAGSQVTNTGNTNLLGDLGLSPGTSVTGFLPSGPGIVHGVTHIADAPALQAKTDLVTAYNDAASRPPTILAAAQLGGQTLGDGVYSASGAALGVVGTLTLDGGGDPTSTFIFQTDSTLITSSRSHVVLIDGAQACNVYWQVGSSATLGTFSTFTGSILAMESITVADGAVVDGQALARTSAVTLDNATFLEPGCKNGSTVTVTAPVVTQTVTDTTTETAAPVTSTVTDTTTETAAPVTSTVTDTTTETAAPVTSTVTDTTTETAAPVTQTVTETVGTATVTETLPGSSTSTVTDTTTETAPAVTSTVTDTTTETAAPVTQTVTETVGTATVTETLNSSTVTQTLSAVTSTVTDTTTVTAAPVTQTVTETLPGSTETLPGSTVTETVGTATVTETLNGSTVTETLPASTSTVTDTSTVTAPAVTKTVTDTTTETATETA
ncbi:MAG: ice-binding family protein, partial [Ornithinibacter sp.]